MTPPEEYGRALVEVVCAIAAVLIFLGLMVQPSGAQEYRRSYGSDVLTITRLSDSFAELEYFNSTASVTMRLTIGEDDLIIDAQVLQGPGAERLTIDPPVGWIAVPPSIEVIDGETGIIELRRGEFIGG